MSQFYFCVFSGIELNKSVLAQLWSSPSPFFFLYYSVLSISFFSCYINIIHRYFEVWIHFFCQAICIDQNIKSPKTKTYGIPLATLTLLRKAPFQKGVLFLWSIPRILLHHAYLKKPALPVTGVQLLSCSSRAHNPQNYLWSKREPTLSCFFFFYSPELASTMIQNFPWHETFFSLEMVSFVKRVTLGLETNFYYFNHFRRLTGIRC